jgi:thiol-disulfide isomerase/thioredoxin
MIRSKSTIVVAPLVMALIVAIGAMATASGRQLALAPGDPAPKLLGRTVDGSWAYPQYGEHKLTIINFWATWCSTCKDQMPILQATYEKHGPSGLDIIGAMYDSVSLQKMQDFADSLGVNYTIMQASNDIVKGWGGLGVFPTTVFVDSEGKIVRRYLGASEEQLAEMTGDIEKLIAGEPLGPMDLSEDEPEKKKN